MTEYTGRQWRVLALSFALGLFAATNLASIANAAYSGRSLFPGTPEAGQMAHPLFPLTLEDRHLDPQTGISRPDNPRP